ncbi:MAG: 50S ribosomal protein L9 [Deltaproteobacteria bacterium RIFCSPLOWO2_02_FULL_50_16]|nr:MAG: 50S ribosomal protein L9 [Deltaproteobacteria bacterium GWA2_50_8]OGQ26265.1 MAG: 50S ribosomal protein L9 [Deltaproteobacteria bacterium RIFCSPHIGHO2_02_FULL_50_15]OGQ56275.1 MAG: 50S ribosomal protein L9 [Deltaproteobacteria bacterium RIFCSPLOWO2_02_FULL_50_16]OGQ65847.1 MAG: 50S ribosomal protein L9 [Deltaproteobacteria bacterium RIFCSPLOWO2_12_FULL_50_11]
MELILCTDIPELGQVGEVVRVSTGYARNYLLPYKKALLASPKNVARLERERKEREVKEAQILTEAQKLADQIGKLSITIAKEVGEEEKLFGSVTTAEIVQELAKENVVIDKKTLLLSEPIKKLGVYNLEVRLHSQVKASVKLWVVKK